MLNSSSLISQQAKAFYYVNQACAIQASSFYNTSQQLFTSKDPNIFANKFPQANKTRLAQCPSCPASMKFNDGQGIDCWVNVSLPLDEKIYDDIFSLMEPNLRYRTRDIPTAQSYDAALNEFIMCEKSVVGAIQNGFITDSSKLRQLTTITTPSNEFDISVAAIIGYIIRDGVHLVHTDILADLFSMSSIHRFDFRSPIRAWAFLFHTAKISNLPVHVDLIK